MTREDAVTTLKDISEMVHKQKEIEKSTLYGILDSNNEPVEALDMAIKALEQEPCDCISRQAVLDEFYEHFADDDLASIDDYENYTKIVKALPSIQPTAKENLVVGDCISRKDLIEYANNLKDGIGITANDIARFPSIQPKKEWIPVSERLPEDFQRVLVTIVNYKGDKVVRVAEYYNRKGVFQIKKNHEQWEVGEKGLLAWMPLPEPYTAESEDKE